MNDAGSMCGGECTSGLRRDIEHFTELHRRALHPLTQRLTINEFSRDEVNGISLINLMDGDDVGMVQRRSSLRFLHEAPHAFPLRSNFSRQNLQRDLAIQL